MDTEREDDLEKNNISTTEKILPLIIITVYNTQRTRKN
jgi:hypothetical protein